MEQFSGWEWFYLDDEAQNVGPFTTEELVEFYAAQGITDDTYGTRLCKAFFLSLSFFVLTVFLPQRVVLYLHFFFSVWAEESEAWQTIALSDSLKAVLQAGVKQMAPAAPEAAEEKAPVPEAAEACKVRAKSMSKRRQSVSLPPASSKKTELTLLKELSEKNYLDQAQWFLNAYWAAEGKKIRFDNNPEECEKVWDMYKTMCELDKKNGKNGNEIDEFGAHIFLEKTVGAITVKKMRQVLVDIDVDFNQMVSLTEALIYSYKIDYKYLVTAVIDDSEAKVRGVCYERGGWGSEVAC